MKTNTPCHILIIEDSPDDRADIRQMLLRGSDRHYRFTEAELGAAGVRACRETTGAPPDCVLLDYDLPDMNAREVLTELCGGSELPPCPVVVLTGSDLRVGSSVLRAGAQDYIGKSWSTPESLTLAIENAIERFELIAERSCAERKLRESEERIRLAARVSGFGIYDYDVAADICNWSPELFALTGVPGDAIIRMETVTSLMHPEDRDRFACGLQAASGSWRDGRIRLANFRSAAPTQARRAGTIIVDRPFSTRETVNEHQCAILASLSTSPTANVPRMRCAKAKPKPRLGQMNWRP